MKILWLYQHMAAYNFDSHLHMEFANVLSCYPGVELRAYGPDLHNGSPHLNLVEYNSKLSLGDLYHLFPFDIVIVNTKSRCFKFYNPRDKKEEGMWLPHDFATWKKTKKIMIEEDYHYEVDDEWYKQMKFDLICQRHYSQSLRVQTVPMHFLPFSVDISTFNPWRTTATWKTKVINLLPHHKRIGKLAFIGNNTDRVYDYRRNTIKKLCEADLGMNYAGSAKQDGEYLEILRQYLGFVSCGSIYEICAAKNLEIIAAGGVLFTNKFVGIDLILPPNCYVAYKNDYSDVLEQARNLIKNKDYAKSIQEHGLRWILDHHTHEIRIKEMLQLFS